MYGRERLAFRERGGAAMQDGAYRNRGKDDDDPRKIKTKVKQGRPTGEDSPCETRQERRRHGADVAPQDAADGRSDRDAP